MKFIEEVINLTVASGSSIAYADPKTEADNTTIVGAVIYHNGLDKNPEQIKAEITCGGKAISKLQHIDNYRSREAGYSDGFKPVEEVESGKRIRFEVSADANFTADFKAELILIKIKNQNC